MTQSIERFRPDEPTEEIVKAIRDDGVAMIENLFDPELMDLLRMKVDSDLEKVELGGGLGRGHKKALAGLFARGREFSDVLMLNERVLELEDAILLPQCPMALSAQQKPSTERLHPARIRPADPLVGPNCHHYRINASVAMQVPKGGDNQFLHRDQWRYLPYMHRDPNGPELTMAIMVAVTEFTAENGATRYIPGSNKWPADREPQEQEVVQAVMPKGSAAFWLGSVYHGFGKNLTNVPRLGIIFSFGLDHLAQEENQFLAVPPEIARTLDPRAQQLLGYRMSPSINRVDGLDSEYILGRPD